MTLRRSWVTLVTAGELVGFAVPALVGAALADAPVAALTAGLVVAGAVEGAVLGLAQAGVLMRVLPTLRRRSWVLVTSGAAAAAWLLGMLPVATEPVWSQWPSGAAVAAAVPLGLLLLVSIGAAQSLLLPAWRWQWVVLTGTAWCAGLGAFAVVTTPLWHPGQPTGQVFAVGLGGGAVMAVVMATVTAQALPRLARLACSGAPWRGSEGRSRDRHGSRSAGSRA